MQIPTIVSTQPANRVRFKWTDYENELYVQFLEENKQILEKQRKNLKKCIFNKMSEYIKNRCSLKCKSHHQKILKKYGSIDEIIKQYKKNGKIQQSKRNTKEKNLELESQSQNKTNICKNIDSQSMDSFFNGIEELDQLQIVNMQYQKQIELVGQYLNFEQLEELWDSKYQQSHENLFEDYLN